ALWGLWAFHVTRGDHAITVPLGHQILKLAEAVAVPSVSLHAHYALGAASFWAGDLMSAREHLERAIAIYDTRPALPPALRAAGDPGAACRAYLGLVLWHLGFPDLALERAREGIALAEQIKHPFTQAYVLSFVAGLHQLRREPQPARECAQAAVR